MNPSENLLLHEHVEIAEKEKKKLGVFSSMPKQDETFSKVLKDKAKEQDQEQEAEKTNAKDRDAQKEFIKIQQLQEELSPIGRLLYDLAYRDPSTWSLADQARYGFGEAQKKGQKLQEFSLELEGNFQNSASYSKGQGIRQAFYKDRAALLDSLSRELLLSQGGWIDSGKSSVKGKTLSLDGVEQSSQVKRNELIRELVRQFSIRKLENGTVLDLKFNPEAVGDLRLSLQVKENQVTATFKTQSQSVCDALNEHLSELSQALEKQGLAVKSLEVQKVGQG